MSTPQDVLLFLYDKSEPKSKELLKHFEYLVNKLQNNKNLLLLRCDVSVNEVEEKLGFTIKPTPKIVFFRNRMKDYPIHFTGSIISTQSLVEFIMENTTFDFEEEWVELWLSVVHISMSSKDKNDDDKRIGKVRLRIGKDR